MFSKRDGEIVLAGVAAVGGIYVGKNYIAPKTGNYVEAGVGAAVIIGSAYAVKNETASAAAVGFGTGMVLDAVFRMAGIAV